ncbi:fibronectin type III domain-containing protein [Micromonospora sp. DH14]|uniref:fibronectin type III domain-containing protein n=1 Tax=Micromonospora sp. DH14 TaxID=3040120 RepID=UPI0024412407|nr:fibronectin type III domain-containing protein [Micromonospora sp. DH14]MDG9674448.1 fibronectin type III domain-containing protein [Micromonospora sp. DH14]
MASLGLGVLLAVTVGPPTLAEAASLQAVGQMSATDLNTMWTGYGNAGGHWTGGDRTVSVPLPDGRMAWLFSDTFLGTVNSDGSRPASSPMVHNTMVIQDQNGLRETLHGGTASAPKSFMCDDSVGLGCWVAGAIVDGSTLRVVVNKYEATGPGSLDVKPTGNALVSLTLPDLAVAEVRDLPLGRTITWGQELLNEAGYTYIYGSEHTSDMKFAHLARVPQGGLAGPWQFWTGSGWSAQEGDSSRIASGVGTAFAVQKIDGRYVLVTVEGHLVFNSAIVAYTAASLTGPFGDPIELARVPEGTGGRQMIVYDTSLHQHMAADGKLLLSYNVNSLNRQVTLDDVTVYRPRFVEVAWPQPQPDPSLVPGSPTNLTASADTDGGVHLSWTAPPGENLRYWVYQKDMTAGQIEWVRLPQSIEQTSTVLAFLKDGHTYQYHVRAANTAGEGPPSTTASAEVSVRPPTAPAALVAAAGPDGSILLNWGTSDRAWYYEVEKRDATAEESEFSPVTHPDGSATTLVVNGLEHHHEYEFRVRGVGGSGAGQYSNPARATASYRPPAAPSALTAAAQSDGTIKLSWTAPPGESWHSIYQRDVTAGETTFTAWPIPVIEGTTATAQYLAHGHEYEFKVVATNRGGESAPSNLARAVSSFALPAAPVGLTADAQADGAIKLAWTASPGDVWYRIYQRDVTAGETELTAWPLPVANGTTATAQYLSHDHEYEFVIASTNQAGESGRSSPARATAKYPSPAAPSELIAVAGDGKAELSWTATQPDVWYNVYQRDVTAGESQFTKWPLPVSEGTTAIAQYLTNGHVYEFKVAGTSAAGEGPAGNIVRVTPQPPLPATPTGLTASAQPNGTVTLAWQAPAPNLWYDVYQRDVTAGESQFTKWPLPVSEGTTAIAQYLTNGHVYEFKVAATNTAGPSPATTPVQVTARYAAPPAPTNLRGSTAGDGKIQLTWDASADDAYSVIYWRDVTAGQSNFTRLEYLTSQTSITMEYLQNTHVYEYKVAATTAGGEGPSSTTIQVTARYSLPSPPSNLTATAGDGKVSLTWVASSTANADYLVYFRDSTAGQSWQRLIYPTKATSQVVDLLVNNHTYDFRVTASNSAGQSAPTNTVSVKPMPPIPQPPSGLTGTPADGKVSLRWTPSSTANVWYWIEMRDISTGQAWIRLKDPVDATAITLDYLTNGHVYEFRVRANNVTGDSTPSNVVSAKPMPPVPQAPSGLTAVAGDGKVSLRWTASPTPNAWYWIESRDTTTGGTWTRAKYPIDGTSITMNFLTNGHVYEFRVRAYNLSGEAVSNVASVRPMPPFPSNASGLRATAGDVKVTLNWVASPTTGAWYYIEMRSNGGSWQRLPYAVECCSFTLNLLQNGTTYEFRVRATNLAGTASGSNIASAKPMPPIPKPPSKLVADGWESEAYIAWTDSPTPYVAYNAYLRNLTRGSGSWQQVTLYGTLNPVHLEYLIPGDEYEFKVTAWNASGESIPSNIVRLRMGYIRANMQCFDNYVKRTWPIPIIWGGTALMGSTWGVVPESSTVVRLDYVLNFDGKLFKNLDNQPVWADSSGYWQFFRQTDVIADPLGAKTTWELRTTIRGTSGRNWASASDSCISEMW